MAYIAVRMYVALYGGPYIHVRAEKQCSAEPLSMRLQPTLTTT